MVAAKKSTKKTTAKTSTTRKPTARKSAARGVQYKSFQLTKSDHPFISWKITPQTIYWLILLVIIIIFQTAVLIQEVNIMDILAKTAAL